ncbi:single-stranded DNA-binding protein [Bacillus cereus]|nr:single-stranded DNA-binding protein [Bacillus cereus]
MTLNRVVLVGRLTKDPDLRYTPNGVAVATFTLAVNRAFANQQGEREADFLNIVIWRKQAENVANYLRKGSLAGVDGRLQTRNYDGQDGKRVYVTEVLAESVQFLEPRNSGRGEQRNSPSQQPVGASFGNQGNSGFAKNDEPFSNVGQPIDISDDDLPF